MNIKPVNVPVESPVSLTETRPQTQKNVAPVGRKDAHAEKAPDLPELEELVADVQKNIKWIHDVDLQFSIHKASGKVIVTVRDESTNKVIREIPPSELLDLSVRIEEMLGLIFDHKG